MWVQDPDEFTALVLHSDTVVVDFTAPSWCRPCQQFAPHFDKAAIASANRGDSTVFIAVDVDKAPWAMEVYGVRGVPTVKFFRDGEYLTDLKERSVIKLLEEIRNYN